MVVTQIGHGFDQGTKGHGRCPLPLPAASAVGGPPAFAMRRPAAPSDTLMKKTAGAV
jgi:hypothetical protein